MVQVAGPVEVVIQEVVIQLLATGQMSRWYLCRTQKVGRVVGSFKFPL